MRAFPLSFLFKERNMITVSPVSDKTQSQFEKLFTQYYDELGCEDDVPHLLSEYVLPDLKAGLISADILFDGENFIGFIIYQVDDIDNEWCHREGWGDIREIFVLPQSRGQGLGKFLILTAEFRLKERGVNKSYCLPAEGTEKFFEKCGYKKVGLYNEELDCFVYEKNQLNPPCNCGKDG